MIPEIGQFALILALSLAFIQTLLPLAGATWGIANWMAVTRPVAAGQLLFLCLAYFSLTYSFITHDFSVHYVANHSNSALPLIYRIVSVWGGHEGSLLLWSLLLSFWTVAVALFSRSLTPTMTARVIGVMGFISCGFLLFMLTTSNPFTRLIPTPADGQDLNPLLQDPGLIVHPPLLYMGYVGFSVAFSFAIAALLGGTLDSAWARWSRPWTLVAWLFLTLGIALGSWWAYYELGWGGWWFWDPVENASLMPWLIGTALIHSLAVTEKRGAFKNWTVLLAILAFSLSLLGTFLVRSGVLTSVHAFATDPERGTFILAFLGTVIGLSLLLYAWRAPTVGSGNSFALVSRESLLLTNNALLAVTCANVLLGTLYPLFLDALGMGKISVGPPYFSKMFLLTAFPLALLLGVGSFTRWKQDSIKSLFYKLLPILIISIVVGISLPILIKGKSGIIIIPDIIIVAWMLFALLKNVQERLIEQTSHQMRRLSLNFYGMTFAHLGVVVFAIGVIISSAYSIEKDIRVEPHQTVEVAGYQFLFTGTEKIQGPNYHADQATIHVLQQGQLVTVLHPQKRIYWVRAMPMTEAAIDAGVTRDIYVALGEPLERGAWSMRIYYKPFIRWIWLGGLLMALGGLLAASDRRYRQVAS